jgi:hypothetical protein
MNRLSAFVLLNSRPQSDRYPIFERLSLLTTALVAVAGTVSAISGWVSAYRTSVVARLYADAAANTLIFGHNSTVVKGDVGSAILLSNAARLATSVQLFAECVALVIIIVMFIAGGLIAFILMKRASNLLESSDTSAPIIASANKTGASVMQRIRRTVMCVFAGFLLRSAFDVLYSISLTADRSEFCAQMCDPCQAALYLISKFLDFSPYIQASVVFISEPLSLIVALWGMTTPRMWLVFVSALRISNREAASPSSSGL